MRDVYYKLDMVGNYFFCLTKYDATSSASLAPVTPAKHQAAHYSGGKLLYCMSNLFSSFQFTMSRE